MADRMAQAKDAVALLADAIATGCILYLLIMTLGPASGAQVSPAVTPAFRTRGSIGASAALA